MLVRTTSAYQYGQYPVRHCLDMPYLELPRSIASGDIIAFVHDQMVTKDGLRLRYTFSGSVYFERMKAIGLYSADRGEISDRVAKAGLTDIYSQCLV
ncbi:hypothetical protein [Anaeroselena agilis]|uniref:Uncharacterized protein n=1 Tax=Anaeroselena agilis TaxID=3063788 RepID=A0ABU3NXN9_9FIRM|nr:hypothetical protein [Selenomonadales bacterium 4137-cl]